MAGGTEAGQAGRNNSRGMGKTLSFHVYNAREERGRFIVQLGRVLSQRGHLPLLSL